MSKNPKRFASYARDPNLGMLGAKQMGRHWPHVWDVARSNPIHNGYVQVLGLDPM